MVMKIFEGLEKSKQYTVDPCMELEYEGKKYPCPVMNMRIYNKDLYGYVMSPKEIRVTGYRITSRTEYSGNNIIKIILSATLYDRKMEI